MKNTYIREMTTLEIEERIVENRNLLIHQRINHVVSPLENPLIIRKLRREVAQLKTELRQRQIKGIK